LIPLACLPLMLSGCSLVLFEPKGQVGIEERNLIILATLLMLTVVIPVFIMTAIFARRYRASNKDANYQPGWSHSYAIEAVTWGFPLLIIIILGTVTWKTTHSLDPYRPIESDAKPINVQVIALDWKWLFIYPDQGIASVNEMAMPVNTPVNFTITSDGAITSFFIPALGGQIYAMAGMQTKLHLIANEPGEYRGIAANYNGQGFSDMNFNTLAVSQADFDRWVAQVKSDPRSLASMDDYNKLAQASIKHPVEHYATVQPNLFQTVVDKYEGMSKVKPLTDKVNGLTETESQ
jgi:cytochrome o ubiquinol oxidase subunit 2